MVHQAPLSNGASTGAAALGENFSRFAHDLTTLMELQVRLLAVDVRDAKRKSGAAAALLMGGAVLMLGCIPVLLLGIAQLLIEFAQWPASGAYACVSMVGLLMGGAVGYGGWRKLMAAAGILGRSREELLETLQWIKRALRPGVGNAEAGGYRSDLRAARFD
jgi:uncharacterized membrane protein YqjE